MKTPEQKYRNDPNYHMLVQHMYEAIDNAHFTPSEMREAAVYACYLHEARNASPPMIIRYNDETTGS